jgi:hypothetical protein
MIDALTSLHGILAWVVIFATAFAGSWATLAHWVESLRRDALWVTQNITHALVVTQVVVGSMLVGFGDIEPDQTHMFYGFLTFVGVGLIIAYRHLSEYRYLLYGLGGLFVMGLSIRALLLQGLA